MTEKTANQPALEQPVLRWWQVTTIITVDGPDAITLLDGLATQSIASIDEGCAKYSLFLDGKAKILAPAIAHRVGPETILIETLSPLAEALCKHLKKYKLRAQATLSIDDVAAIAIIGAPVQPTLSDSDIAGSWTHLATDAFDIWTFLGSPDDARSLVKGADTDAFTATYPQADPDELDVLRIAAGQPDLTDFTIGAMPAEVSAMDHAVSLDKGCYLGQEPVARLYWRGAARRTLRRVELRDDIPDALFPAEADESFRIELLRANAPEGARPIGWLTSWAKQTDTKWPAMAVLRTEIEAGDELVLVADDSVRVLVVDSPPSPDA